MTTPELPMTVDAWRESIRAGLELDVATSKAALADDAFPYDRLSAWVASTYTEIAGDEFVAAVQRNIRGLVDWVYVDGGEPFWPGSDDSDGGLESAQT